MSFSISGKTAIISGAASGIGLAVARHFLEQGANVVLADQSDKRLKAGCDDLADHEQARLFVGDLRERARVVVLVLRGGRGRGHPLDSTTAAPRSH